MRWSKMLLTMGIGLSMLYVKAESQTGTVSGGNADAVVHFSNKTDTSYSMHAAPGGSWVFTEDFDWSGPNGWYSDAKFTISCERLSSGTTAFVDASLCFGASMNGRMYIPGEEDGGTIPWSVSAAYHAAPQPYIWPAEAVLAVGEEKSFRYGYDNVFYTNPGGFWKYTGTNVSGDSVQITWQNVGANYNLPTTLQAGQYMLTAARNTQGAFSANASATVVGVKQIAATSGSTTVTSTTDSPGANETLYVAKGAANVTITATPEPGSAWPTNKPTWTGVTGNGATATFTPSTTGETIITATCGNSKAIKLIVYNVEAVNVDASTPASTKINYKLEPSSLKLTGSFKVGSGTTTSKEVSGDFNFTFNQNLIAYDTTTILLELLTPGQNGKTISENGKENRKSKRGTASAHTYTLVEGQGYRYHSWGGCNDYYVHDYSVSASGKLLEFKIIGSDDITYPSSIRTAVAHVSKVSGYTYGFSNTVNGNRYGLSSNVASLSPAVIVRGSDFIGIAELNITSKFDIYISFATPDGPGLVTTIAGGAINISLD